MDDKARLVIDGTWWQAFAYCDAVLRLIHPQYVDQLLLGRGPSRA